MSIQNFDFKNKSGYDLTKSIETMRRDFALIFCSKRTNDPYLLKHQNQKTKIYL